MKSVLLVRHAKSSWEYDVDDFERPLNHRGERDAPAMAKRLLKKEVKIDGFISSPAKRALATATHFASVYGEKQKNIIIVHDLYEPTIEAFYNAIDSLDDDLKRVAVFSHNPGITFFANKLTGVTVDDMPTCAVFGVKADIKKWNEFSEAKKEFWFFDYPRSH